jgi:hypothetical protein
LKVAADTVFGLNKTCVEPELFVQDGVSLVSSAHVLVSERDWDDAVQVKVVEAVDNQTHQHDQTAVLKVG